jgi:hypothetical protein
MKRNNVKVDNIAIIKYCKREHGMQARVYPGLIDKGKMKKYEANQFFIIITELQEIATELEQKGYKWHELRQLINGLPGKRSEAQQKQLKL